MEVQASDRAPWGPPGNVKRGGGVWFGRVAAPSLRPHTHWKCVALMAEDPSKLSSRGVPDFVNFWGRDFGAIDKYSAANGRHMSFFGGGL